MSIFLQHVVNGLIVGSVYVLVALGVTLVYGLTRLINFAHGELVTFGALVTYALTEAGIPFFPAMLLVAVIGGLLGLVLDRFCFRFTRDRPINGLMVSLGLIAAFQAVVIMTTNDEPKSIPAPIKGTVEFLGVRLTQQRMFVLAATVVMFGLLYWFLKKGRMGQATRAFAENPDAAAMMGINGDRVVSMTFVIGSAQAAVAGALAISMFPASVSLGGSMTVKAFAVALIGGLGSVTGAVMGGIGVGLAESLGAAYVSDSWTSAFGFVLMLAILMVRPTGLAKGAAGADLH